MKRYEESETVDYVKIPSRPISVCTAKVISKARDTYKRKPGTSVRKLAAEVNIPKSTLSDIKVKKLNLKARTKKILSKYVKDQSARVKSGARYVADRQREA